MNIEDINNFEQILKGLGLVPYKVNIYAGGQINMIPPFITPTANTYYMFEGEIIFNGFGVNQNVTFMDVYNNNLQLNFVTTAIKTTDSIHFDKLYFRHISCTNFSTFMVGTIVEIIVQ